MAPYARSRFWIAAVLVGAGMIAGYLLPRAQPASSAPAAVPPASGATGPRFIDFDIGTVTIDFAATRPNTDLGYVYLPDGAGLQPRTAPHFTMPPDFATGTDVTVRLLWAGETSSCAMVVGASLNGRGAQHVFPNAASYLPYWAGSETSSPTHTLQSVQGGQSVETVITFRPVEGRPTYPGDAMRFSLYRDSGAPTDTCAAALIVQSVTVTYQGQTTYAPLVQR